MKRILILILVLLLEAILVCTASAEDYPDPAPENTNPEFKQLIQIIVKDEER